MRAGLVGSSICALCVIAAASCGDDEPSGFFVAVISPAPGAELGEIDDVGGEPGIQIDVELASNARGGATFELAIETAGGAYAVWPAQAVTAADGAATFAAVTLPAGEVTLTARCVRGCGSATDGRSVLVIGAVGCELDLDFEPKQIEFYAPLPVLDAALDVGAQDGFQGSLTVTTEPGFEVELFVLDVERAQETVAGSDVVADGGSVSMALSLGKGPQAVRATCVSPGGTTTAAAATHTLFVDVVRPSCELIAPAPSLILIPDHDIDAGQPGTQVVLGGRVTSPDNDVDGEVALFRLGLLSSLEGSPVQGGETSVTASFTSPGMHAVAVLGRDHAGNRCNAGRDVEFVTEGCSIQHMAPAAVVTADVSADPGLQAALSLQIDPACAGRTVQTTCDATGPRTATVGADGLAELEITLCADDACTTSYDCESSVVSAAGILTSTAATISVDNQAPGVTLQLVAPSSLACGANIDAASDVDGDSTNGLQIDVRVVAPAAASRSITVEHATGLTTFLAGAGDTRITLEPGINDIVAAAADQNGNTGSSATCRLTLVDIALNFSQPVAGGLLGSSHGSVAGSDLTTDICGTLGEPGATVNVTIDGGPAGPAVVSGTSWCLSGAVLAESTTPHEITATASLGFRVGAASVDVRVDLTGPDAPAGLSMSSPNRQAGVLAWTVPAGTVGYEIKVASVPLSEGNFAGTGTIVAAPTPGAAGSTDSITIQQLRAGQSYHFGVLALDAAGNRSAVSGIGPLVTDTTSTGTVQPPDAGNGDNKFFGYALASGTLNDDIFPDLAIGVPFENNGATSGAGAVYVYLGGPSGIDASAPDFVIRGTSGTGQLGYGVTFLRQNGDAFDDLAIGAPFDDNFSGSVYIFHGGNAFAPGPGTIQMTSAAAQVRIRADASSWFAFAGVGWSLATARFDSDGTDDLVIGVPAGGGGYGGFVVLHGGYASTSIVLHDTNPSGMGDAVATLFKNPLDTGDLAGDFALLGNKVVNLGRTRGAGDNTDDIGVSQDAESLAPGGARVYVIRGRANKPASGMQVIAFDPTADLELVPAAGDATTAFGETLGSIADVNGDGARDLVVPSFLQGGSEEGVVVIADGDAVGTHPLASLAITTITGDALEQHFGSAVVNNATAPGADIDMDGSEDLLIVGGRLLPTLYIWYGPTLPTGSVSLVSADHTVDAPAGFHTVLTAGWVGDVDQDGLDDLFWADPDLDNPGTEQGRGELLLD